MLLAILLMRGWASLLASYGGFWGLGLGLPSVQKGTEVALFGWIVLRIEELITKKVCLHFGLGGC